MFWPRGPLHSGKCCEREKAELGCRASHFRNSQFRNTLAFRNSAERKPRGKQHGDHRG
jgi:hypothetical protein